ncbi:hypothetical protein [Paenibacillus aquistagni]|uniref:hypothetical protein n=1 Tax=Paenibacillus aquistagni TaxID=1852522 RepID=UPI00111C18EF|nr:hypothetical protein [Paenibacillus aquistagni]
MMMQAEGTAVILISRVFGFLFWDELRGEKKRAAGNASHQEGSIHQIFMISLIHSIELIK